MTHKFFLSIFFLATSLVLSQTAPAATRNKSSTSVSHGNVKAMTIPADPSTSGMALPANREEETGKKHMIKTDELAHIHHFHKERVKKLKRHHKKYWMLSKILLIICHLVLLVCAYIHLTH